MPGGILVAARGRTVLVLGSSIRSRLQGLHRIVASTPRLAITAIRRWLREQLLAAAADVG